ncbi:ThiF family adenylyltransferase [Galbitalea sp. SE-J8]|uniref:ThiF family adenylyltransferase n=1 Tax=Galbitalea sp. SE-J8 TaxID=3054952 RepID=UPI00259D1F2D|nr:ThiF family adenylyltransferase [Galbitalea sp. SE-J8]MDM4762871.1 ThiF family adenylyltransferase [Galbitalea sp. SE-J8]
MPDATSPRYARQTILPEFGPEAQRRLAAARVLVVGAGGLGSHVIPALAAAGVGEIAVVDDDVVELSNLHRQTLHGVDDLGAFKTASAAESVARLDPDVRVTQHPTRFTAGNALRIAADADLVIDGSDNFPTRYLANDVAVLLRLPLVWGAVSRFGGQVGVAWAARGPHYRDLFPAPPPPGSVLSCAEGGVFPATVAVIGALMAAEALKVLTGVGEPLVGRIALYDALTASFEKVAYDRDPAGVPVERLIDYDAFCGTAADESDPVSVTPTELAAELAAEPAAEPAADVRLIDVRLIDVREPWEHDIAHLAGARLVPLATLPDAVAGLDPDARYVLYCHHGVRSRNALDYLVAQGFTGVRHLEGGIDAWAREVAPGMPRY